MRKHNALEILTGPVWAITDAGAEIVQAILARRLIGERLNPEEIAQRIGSGRRPEACDGLQAWDLEAESYVELEAAKPMAPQISGRQVVAVVGIYGTIVPRASMLSDTSGVMSSESIAKNVRAMASDPNVSAIVLDIDSPGGAVRGSRETAAEIRAARKHKPIVAVANYEAQSLAYWYASQASEIVASPSSLLGSIGVLGIHTDESAALEQEGKRVTVLRYGENKGQGNPFEPLSESARAEIEKLLQETGRAFDADVARGRGVGVETVRGRFGQGSSFSASDAVSRGMADSVGTLEDGIRRAAALARGAEPSQRQPAATGEEDVTRRLAALSLLGMP